MVSIKKILNSNKKGSESQSAQGSHNESALNTARNPLRDINGSELMSATMELWTEEFDWQEARTWLHGMSEGDDVSGQERDEHMLTGIEMQCFDREPSDDAVEQPSTTEQQTEVSSFNAREFVETLGWNEFTTFRVHGFQLEDFERSPKDDAAVPPTTSTAKRSPTNWLAPPVSAIRLLMLRLLPFSLEDEDENENGADDQNSMTDSWSQVSKTGSPSNEPEGEISKSQSDLMSEGVLVCDEDLD